MNTMLHIIELKLACAFHFTWDWPWIYHNAPIQLILSWHNYNNTCVYGQAGRSAHRI